MAVASDEYGWMSDATCAGATSVFFGDIWPDDPDTGEPTEFARLIPLAKARAICDACPVRIECREYTMKMEYGLDSDERYGVSFGRTPRERSVLDVHAPTRTEIR